MDKKLKDLWNKKKMALKYSRYAKAEQISKEMVKLLEKKK